MCIKDLSDLGEVVSQFYFVDNEMLLGSCEVFSDSRRWGIRYDISDQ
jgi:hypothetical protein